MSLASLLARLDIRKIETFEIDSDNGFTEVGVEADIHNGNAVMSNVKAKAGGHSDNHVVAIDVDVPAYLVPSSTPGHSHLYIDKNVSEESYFKLLDALADCGIIERGYADASKKQGGTCLRLPWVKKEKPKADPLAGWEPVGYTTDPAEPEPVKAEPVTANTVTFNVAGPAFDPREYNYYTRRELDKYLYATPQKVTVGMFD